MASCILHVSKEKTNDNLFFDITTWNKVFFSANLREDRPKKSKYTDVCNTILSSTNFDDTFGYHSACYSNFTAVPRSRCSQSYPDHIVKPDDAHKLQKPLLRSNIPSSISSSNSGVLKAVCVFCNQHTKRHNNGQRESLGSCEAFGAQANIQSALHRHKDEVLLPKLGGIDFIAKEVKYHHSCRRKYTRDLKQFPSGEDKHDDSDTMPMSDQKKLRDIHKKTFAFICDYVRTTVIENNSAEPLSVVHERYMQLLVDHGEYESQYRAHKLLIKLHANFPSQLSTYIIPNKGPVLYCTGNTEHEAVTNALLKAVDPQAAIVGAAVNLGSQILKLQSTSRPLPESLQIKDVCDGEGDPPEDLKLFFRTLYTGTPGDISSGERVDRYIESAADDAVFCTTRGKIKPAKHITLGLTMKSLTGSKKVITILNRLGHCVSYSLAESIETDLATTISIKDDRTPEGITQQPGLATGLAWDNFDHNTETLSGGETLHDTVGICYQNIPLPNNAPSQNERSSEGNQSMAESTPRKKRKRSFQFTSKDIQPYTKKPRISTFSYVKTQTETPQGFRLGVVSDIAWMMSCALFKDTPMWSGWNAKGSTDHLPAQVIAYMNNINLPSTRLDVVAETLRQSQEVARECGESYAIVTYDLAIAKPALLIQAEETPLYDNVFVCFGGFHITMAYFASLSYLLDESGGPHILVDTGVIASGSLSGFLSAINLTAFI